MRATTVIFACVHSAGRSQMAAAFQRARGPKQGARRLRGHSSRVTMGCGEACPVTTGVERQDWPLVDPMGHSVEAARGIRDEIADRVRNLVSARGWECAATRGR